MFKWGRRDKPSSYEPKTPKLASVALPDGRYTPMPLQPSHSERPPSNLLLRRMTPADRRATTPMYESRHSRSRTISTPSRGVEAPRPIRPHPSQGPYIPVLEDPHRIRIELSRAPVSVPSAQFLEEQIRNNPVDPAIVPPTVHRMLHGPEYEYPEERHLKEVARKVGGAEIKRVLSKAYIDDIEEQKRERLRGPSAPPLKKGSSKGVVEFDNWKAVPVTTTPPKPIIEPEQKGALKSALKKTPVPKAIKPVLKDGHEKAYYSENESSRRQSDRMKPIRVTKTPSKAWLEEQAEQLEREQEMKRGRPSHQYSHSAQARPVYGPGAFAAHTNSSATPSPADDNPLSEFAHNEGAALRRRRSTSQQSSSYIPAYIKESDPDYLQLQHELLTWETNPPVHGKLSWPLIEYATRKRHHEPLIYFDAGFNPRNVPRFAVKAKRGMVYEPLTREEETMGVSTNARMLHMTIVNRKLEKWPIHIVTQRGIRVIDVFRAIYDTYSQPLTHGELKDFGAEYIDRCKRAFLQRCHDSPEFDHIEERRGMLRIDLMRGRRIFKGLIPVSGQPWTYELLFDDGR